MPQIRSLGSIALRMLVGPFSSYARLNLGLYADEYVAEDTKDAGRRLPWSLMGSVALNEILCIIVAVLICLCAGNVDDLFAGPYGASGHPNGSMVQLTVNVARGNKTLASVPFALMAPIILMCVVNTTAAASRIVFSFIRDDRNTHVQQLLKSVGATYSSSRIADGPPGSREATNTAHNHYPHDTHANALALDHLRLIRRLSSNILTGDAVISNELHLRHLLFAVFQTP
jgi:hypothetical protein